MNMKHEFDAETARNIVYVRPVPVSELPAELQGQVGTTRTVYAVHAESGDRLALVRDRQLAFVLARQNDLAPVSVH